LAFYFLHSFNFKTVRLHFNVSTVNVVHIIESSSEGCFSYNGHGDTRRYAFWTAGQRTDPSWRSPFIWRLISPIVGCKTEFHMVYSNWTAGQPDYYQNSESCMQLSAGYDYLWNDGNCDDPVCSICELDLST